MTKALVIILLLTPATALAWRYVVFEEGQLSYDGNLPPLDISYPPPGEPTPTVKVGAPQEGEIMTADQIAEQRRRPHVVIVPPVATHGNRTAASSTVETEPPLPIAVGSSAR